MYSTLAKEPIKESKEEAEDCSACRQCDSCCDSCCCSFWSWVLAFLAAIFGFIGRFGRSWSHRLRLMSFVSSRSPDQVEWWLVLSFRGMESSGSWGSHYLVMVTTKSTTTSIM